MKEKILNSANITYLAVKEKSIEIKKIGRRFFRNYL